MPTQRPICCTYTCFDDLKNFVGATNYNLLLDKGLVESNTINGEGIVCKLIKFVNDNNISITDTMSILDRLLDKGFVWKCTPDNVIASIETYLKYAEAVGLTQSAAVPA
jgi:hypothetical protein